MQLQKRQSELLKALFLKPLGTTQLLAGLERTGFAISEDTLQRELKVLVGKGLISSEGAGPNRSHQLTTLGCLNVMHADTEIEAYLRDDSRLNSRYSPDIPAAIVSYLKDNTLSKVEQSIVTKYQEFIASLDHDVLSRWRQKWLIEFAWKSSSIEGNTYSILETETLLLDKVEATGKSHQEAIMIVNHQKAYDFILKNKTDFGTITMAQVVKIHELLVDGLDVSFGLRDSPVRISGSKYIPLTHRQHIAENLENIIRALNTISDPLDKALASLLLIAYLQPFADGNKRTSRVLANAILEHHNYPPIILGGIEPTRYRRACIAFYEMTTLRPMSEIIQDSYSRFLEIE